MLSASKDGATVAMVQHQIVGRLPPPTVVEDEPSPMAELGLLRDLYKARIVPECLRLLLLRLLLQTWPALP